MTWKASFCPYATFSAMLFQLKPTERNRSPRLALSLVSCVILPMLDCSMHWFIAARVNFLEQGIVNPWNGARLTHPGYWFKHKGANPLRWRALFVSRKSTLSKDNGLNGIGGGRLHGVQAGLLGAGLREPHLIMIRRKGRRRLGLDLGFQKTRCLGAPKNTLSRRGRKSNSVSISKALTSTSTKMIPKIAQNIT